MPILRGIGVIVFALMILGVVVISNAQQRDATCPALIEQALGTMGNNCGGLDRNSACYGFQDVDATFILPTSPDFFSEPSDRAGLANLKNIGTSSMDTALNKWGIALMSVQANLPDTLPGQNTIFMLLGDTQVENAVKPVEAFSGGTVLTVTTQSDSALFHLPDAHEHVVEIIPAGTALSADAINPAGDFVRVASGDQSGWVAVDTLVPQDSLKSLAVMTPETHTPMQFFYLRTGLSGTECTQAPDSLIVQGPRNLQVDINVNGADIQLGSTIALRLLPLTNDLVPLFAPLDPDISKVTQLMELDVIDGHAILNPGTPNEIVVGSGFRTVICLSEPENLGLDQITNDRHTFPACPWLQPTRWRLGDLLTYSKLEGVTLNYPIHMPDLEPPTLTPTRTRRPVIIQATRTPTPEKTGEATSEVTDTLAPPRDTDTPTATDTPTDIPTDTPTDVPTDTPTPTENIG